MSEKHATVKLYWIICVVLCLITAAEWAVFQLEHLRGNAMFMIPALVIMSIVKFILVCGWYMHLRYDHPMLIKYYLSAIFLSGATVFALGVLLS